MGTHGDIVVRIDEIESELRRLSGEIQEIRALTTEAIPSPAPDPAPAPARPRTARESISHARWLLSEGRAGDALAELDAAIAAARGDGEALSRLAAELDGIARYRPTVRAQARELADLSRASMGGPVTPPPAVAPAPPAAAPPARPLPRRAPAPVEPAEPRRSLADLARDWDLLGPRGFAVVGGAVTALGIILLFVLATNRGWITPGMRVAIGAFVSAVAVGAGFVIRHRYGQMQASLGAAGAGIAGGYASLAAATARYDLVPDWLALPLAGCIAALAVAIALAWRSEIVAGVGLLGSALAPGLQAIDTDLTWPSAAFAVIVLAATVAVTVPRRWHRLLIAIAAVVVAQVAWLAMLADHAAGAGTVAVVAALALTVLAAGIWLQLVSGTDALDPLATPFVLGGTGLALVLTPLLFESDRDLGLTLLGGAAVWAVAWAVLRGRQPALALVLGVASLTLATVASSTLLSGSGLAITWAAESILFTALAWRLRDARLQLTGLVYAALAGGHVLSVDAPGRLLFDEPVDAAAAIPVAAVALAALAAGVLAPAETEARTETGMLAWLEGVRAWLTAHRDRLREAFVLGALAAAWYAASIALVAASFRYGHLAAVVLASTMGVVATALTARRGSIGAVAASLSWLVGVFVLAVAFDVPEFENTWDGSFGGWALLAASAGVVGGGYAFQVFFPSPGRPWIPAAAAVTALVASLSAIALLAPDEQDPSAWIGVRELVPAAVFAALSAGVFRIERHRSLATVMWSCAATALVWSELLLVPDNAWRAVAVGITGLGLGALATPLAERRLWFAGWGLTGATAIVTLTAFAIDWWVQGVLSAHASIAGFGVAVALVGLAALQWRTTDVRDFVTVSWSLAIGLVLFGEAFLLHGESATGLAAALTGAAVALLAAPLREERLWWAAATVVSATSAAVLVLLTPVDHFLRVSASPGDGLWVAAGCLAAGVVLHFTAVREELRRWIDPVGAIGALYLLSLGILETAQELFGGSVETNFERGHVGVSVVWALIGLALLVAGLLRDSTLLRYGGLALFGLSLAKIFLFDLSALSSVARALSFIAVGGLVLAGGFFLQRLSSQIGPRRPQSS